MENRPNSLENKSLAPDKRKPLSAKSGTFALLLSTLWSANPVATKAGLLDCGPLRYGYLRFTLGGITNLIWAFATKKSFKITPNEFKPLLLLGALFSAQLAFLNIGQDLTTAGHGSIIISTFPLWSAIFAHMFVPGDQLSKLRLFGTLIAYAGVVVVFYHSLYISPGMNQIFFGDILMLCSAVLLGLRQIYLSQLGQVIKLHKLLIAQSIFGILSFGLASLYFESNDPFLFTPQLLISLFYTCIVIAGLAFLGQTWLLRNYLPSRVTVLSLSQPIFGILLSWVILGEPIGSELYIGAVLVIAGSFLAQKK